LGAKRWQKFAGCSFAGTAFFLISVLLPKALIDAVATIFFGTMLGAVTIGSFVPLIFGRETVGRLETVTEAATAPA
jgi:hypothetical protein